MKKPAKPDIPQNQKQKEQFRTLKPDSNLYRQMFEHSVIAILIHDLNMNIIDVNDKAIELFGYSKEELLKQKVYALHTESELENSASVREKMKETDKLSVETSFRRKDGSIFFAAVTPTKYILDGTPIIHVYIQDITERKRNEENIAQALEKARESDRLKSAFLANMSHEIRTPMTAIMGFTSFLKTPGINEEKLHKYTRIISDSASHLLSIIDNIIDIAKIEAGQLKVSNANINVNSLMQDLYEFFKSFLKTKNKEHIQLILKIPSSEFFIVSDESRLRQILNNLLNNAIKFTEEGTIEFGFDQDGENLKFYVKDSGIGIPEKYKDIVFNRFAQATQATEIYEGTGLGLAIALACTKLLGGEIWFESEENKGSTFFFSIPENSQTDRVMEPDKDIAIDYQFKGELILVAEDDPYSFEYIERLLHLNNLQVLNTTTGDETINKTLENDRIKLVLMDIQMPGISGMEAAKKIKKHRPQLPILAQTAYTSKELKEQIISTGFDGYLTKPFDKEKLLKLIYDNLKKSAH